MRIAYLVNQYPKISHSFIRREIEAIEQCGLSVVRFSIRGCTGELVDAADRREQTQTQVLLQVGIRGLLWGLVRTACDRPRRFFQALALACQIGWNSDRGLWLNLAYLAEACVLLHRANRLEIDHIHAHFGTNPAAVAMLCHTLGGPTYSFTVHGPEEFDKPAAIALTEKIHRAAFVVAISSFGKSQLYRWCHHSQWSKIQVIHCGVDDTFLQQPISTIPDRPRLVCIGRLEEQKGHLLLVQAVRQVVAQGIAIQVVLVGDGSLRAPIEAMIRSDRLEQAIQLVGWADSQTIQRHLTEARAMVLPSFAEGLPVVIMEALALGRPVITTTVAGIPELVDSGRCGWLVPPGSVEALAEALKTALTTPPAQLQRMGQQGREQVMRHHTAAVEAARLATLFYAQRRPPAIDPVPSVDTPSSSLALRQP